MATAAGAAERDDSSATTCDLARPVTGPSADLPPKPRVVRVRAEEHDGAVPRISEFYGIVIEMYFADHPPPHFHARYGGEEATIMIASGAVLAGSLPGRALRLVREWLAEHREELNANWERARTHEAPEPIAPLT